MTTPVTSKEITADGAVSSAPGALVGVALTGGSDVATLVLYDNSAASGTKLVTIKAAANTTATYTPAAPLSVSKAIYADITGTGPAAYIAYW